MCLEGEERGKEGRVEEVVKGRGICSRCYRSSLAAFSTDVSCVVSFLFHWFLFVLFCFLIVSVWGMRVGIMW